MAIANRRIWQVFSALLAVLVALTDAGFFFFSWAINADSLGAHQMDWALTGAFWSAILMYVSLGLAAVALVAGPVGMGLRLPTRWVWVSGALALVPMGYLVVMG